MVVAAWAEPVGVTPVALLALVRVHPLVPVAADTLMLKPDAVIDAVPALLVGALAVQAAAAVAFAVAPDDTTRMSVPLPPRSVMVSVPASTLNVSAPAPPVSLSLPAPPVSVSVPEPPMMLSAPADPVIVKPFGLVS